MCRTKRLTMLLAVAILALSGGIANAQTNGRTGWSGRALHGAKVGRTAARVNEMPTREATAGQLPADARANKASGIVGTWRIHIPESDGGLPPFNAYHTFAEGGTFTEVSDLLTTLTESPAHGVWTGKKLEYQLTFELFVFDPETKEPAGRVRVRCAIHLAAGGDTLEGDTVVDFIAPDGTLFEGVDSGPFSGERLEVVPYGT